MSLVVAALVLGGQSTLGASLTIRAMDPGGRPVPIAQAQLYLDYWGGGETVALAVNGSTVTVPLGRDWLCRQWRALCDDGYLAARIVVRAKGFASAASNRFTWIGSVDDPNQFANRATSPARVVFARHDPLVISAGTNRTLVLTMRPTEPRSVRVVDDGGHEVAGASVTAYELFARSNHCGHPEGTVILEGKKTDIRGAIDVPDTDMTCALMVTKPHYRVIGVDDDVVETALLKPATIVRLHRLTRRPLRLAFSGLGTVGKIPVQACFSRCTCGACCGTLGETDAKGRLTVEDFYPEEYDVLFVAGEGTTRRWEADPKTLGAATVTATLR